MKMKNKRFLYFLKIGICLILFSFIMGLTVVGVSATTCDDRSHRWSQNGTCGICGVSHDSIHRPEDIYIDDNLPNNTHSRRTTCDECQYDQTFYDLACSFSNGVCIYCGASQHTHSYTQKNTSSTYLKSSATCTKLAEYYYSCECGAMGTSVFTSGSMKDHFWLTDGTCDVCGIECQHNFIGNDCDLCGLHVHSYTQKNTSSTYLKSSATCTKLAEYYYSCDCGAKGTGTFTGGSLNDHRWLTDGTCDVCGIECQHNFTGNDCDLCGLHVHSYTQKNTSSTYLKSNATCTKLAEYYYSCECGAKGSSTFTSGSLNDHRWLTDGTCDVCGAECQHTFSGNNCTVCGWHKHSYTVKNTDTTYLKTNATCSELGEYYYSCDCGAKGTSTFDGGSLKAHRWLTDGTCEACGVECQHSFSGNNCTVCGWHKHSYTEKNTSTTYLKTNATCSKLAVYYYSCDCGAKGTSTFEGGSLKAHRWLTDGTCEACGVECSHIPDIAVHYVTCKTCNIVLFGGYNLSDKIVYMSGTHNVNRWSNSVGATEYNLSPSFDGVVYFSSARDDNMASLQFPATISMLTDYLFIKYRVPDTSSYVRLIMNVDGSSHILGTLSIDEGTDGWDVVCLNLKSLSKKYTKSENHTIKFELHHKSSVDIAYIATSDDLSALRGLLQKNEVYYIRDSLGVIDSQDIYDKSGTHLNHSFTETNTDIAFIQKNATCSSPAVYYYSCECGSKSTSTFISGILKEHRWLTDGTCDVCGVECQHNFTGNECDFCGWHKHSYNVKNTDVIYLKSNATCAKLAEYYYSCDCGQKGDTTFTDGVLKDHRWLADGTCEVCGSEHEHVLSDGNKCDNCNYHLSHVYDASGKCIYGDYKCSHQSSSGDSFIYSWYEFDNKNHWTVNECQACFFLDNKSYTPEPHAYGDSGITCTVCYYNSNPAPDEEQSDGSDGGSTGTCEKCDIEFSHCKLADNEWHMQIGKCKICSTEYELVLEKHTLGSDRICIACAYEAPDEPESDSSEETESDTIADDNGSDTKLEFNPLLLIPAAALIGIVAIVIVLIARRKRR